jgi:hypothetical protein
MVITKTRTLDLLHHSQYCLFYANRSPNDQPVSKSIFSIKPTAAQVKMHLTFNSIQRTIWSLSFAGSIEQGLNILCAEEDQFSNLFNMEGGTFVVISLKNNSPMWHFY